MTLHPNLRWFLLILLAAVAPSASVRRLSAADVDFIQDVRPILINRCYRCHSSLQQESGLRLDQPDAFAKGGDGGPVLVAGRSGESRLVLAIERTGDLKMPPEGEALRENEIALIKRWIDEGAKLPRGEQLQHWSFVPPKRKTPPKVNHPDWPATAVDAWIAARLDDAGLAPSPPADRLVLARRLTLDLIGLPPTAELVQEFLDDEAPDATERLVDRLLADPRHGERWGRHWMDVWRYSDWDGYGAEVRESQPHIWRWRDWIIQAINGDKPYNRMIVEMLAGDEVAPTDPDTLRATGFLVRNWFKFNRNVWLDNTVEHTGKAFVGLTFNCARCHDHMYDPVSQVEYYQLRAIFEPYDVRTDLLPGVSDVTKDGLVRAYDAKLESPTYVFTRGDEKQPEKERPVEFGIPKSLLAAPLSCRPIELEAAAYYPGSRSYVQQMAADQAAADLKKALAAAATSGKLLEETQQHVARIRTAQLGRKPAAAAPPAEVLSDDATAPLTESSSEATLRSRLARAEAAAADSQATLAVAKANADAVAARIAADRAQYQTPPAPQTADLARAAGNAERQLALRKAEQAVGQAREKLAVAREALLPDNEQSKKAVADAETALATQEKAFADATQAAMQPGETYTRFGEVYPTSTSGRRLALAQWIAGDDNPLSPRVAANQLWLRHFGTPLVATVFDFGVNGKPPSHPELLDLLSRELVDGQWQMKRVHRLLVTSAVYRQSSRDVQGHADPENTRYWRMNVRRMEAEVVRDAMLFVSGQLDERMFGPDLDPASGLTLPRRSLYFRNSKEKKMTFLSLFDSPNVVECYRRSESIAPQQALALANSNLSLVQARILAARISSEVSRSRPESADRAFVEEAFCRVLGRPIREAERGECVAFLADQAARLRAGTLTPFGGPSDDAVKPSPDPGQRARESLVHVLLNHNDFVSIR